MSIQIKDMFTGIAGKYDLLNDFLSFGIHRLWKKRTVSLSQAKSGFNILDCATGTGDLAIEFKKVVGIEGQVIATDFNDNMLKIASQKFNKKNYEIKVENADAMNLKYEDDTYDISSIAFGIRNVDSITKCLEEMARVVKPNGKVIVLEFGQPQGVFRIFYNFYSKFIIPIIGNLISRNRIAYKYLISSASKFPCREEFTGIMNDTGKFSEIIYYKFTFGIAYLYIGIVK